MRFFRTRLHAYAACRIMRRLEKKARLDRPDGEVAPLATSGLGGKENQRNKGQEADVSGT